MRSLRLDGEAVWCGQDGVSDFERQADNDGVFLYASDLLELNGDDWRNEPLEKRKSRLAKLLRNAQDGVRLNDHLDGEGPIIFKHACRLGLEGIVSKRRDMPYRSGRSKSWIKIQNPQCAAIAACAGCQACPERGA